MWGRFFIPVLALFYIASQVPLEQFAIIMGVFSLAILVLEIPSGVVADLIGRKNTLLVSRFLYLIELFMIAFYDGFWIFLIAKIISGFAVSLSSGADEALLYDSLKKMKREKEHKTVSGRLYTYCNISMAFTFIVGAFLFGIHYKLPAIVSLPVVGIGFILTFFLKEPYKSSKCFSLKNSYQHMKEGFNYFWDHSYIKYLVFYSVPIAAAIAIMLSISSAYFEEILFPVALMGVVAFIGSMIAAFSSKKAHNLEEKFGEKKSLFFIQAATVLGIFLMALMINYVGVLFFFIISFVSGFFGVVVNHYMNVHIETSHRATMLSIKNFFSNFAIFLLFPAVGYVAKVKSMGTSFLYFGIVILIFVVALQLYSTKLRIKQIE